MNDLLPKFQEPLKFVYVQLHSISICVKYNAEKKILLSFIFPINLNHFQFDYKSNQIILDIL